MLSVEEAAHRTERHPETIRRWIRAGRLRARTVGSRYVIDERDLLAAAEPPHSIGLLPEWERFESGEPQPDWVKLIHRSREGH